MIKVKKKSLLRQLKWTVLGLSTAMLAMWFLFYINTHRIIQDYVLENMEQVAVQVLDELNRSFLQIEEASFELSDKDSVRDFLEAEDSLDFYTKAGELEGVISQFQKESSVFKNLILYNDREMYYRFYGNISNTGMQRMMTVLNKDDSNRYIRLHLDGVNYIGFVSLITYQGTEHGKVVMLADEKDIYQMFSQLTRNEKLGIALAADGAIILSNQSEMLEQSMTVIVEESEYLVESQVGFTPFELLVSYEDTDQKISTLFLVAMIIMALILFTILEVFIHFWQRKFFTPIQTVILEVEGFESGQGETLPLTGLEHFDGLVCGINEMVERIEQKEKEIYQAAYSLQEAEIKKQKALIISLKKQISAHFTVNVLTIIKALSAEGEGKKAGLLCDGLSFLLRYANAGDSFISGMDEFFVLDKYIEIMEIRYPKRFDAVIDYSDELEDIELPRMLIQPIIENSIIHGLLRISDKRKGKIHIYCLMDNDKIEIIVEDNGAGMTLEELDELRENLFAASENDIEVKGLSHVALLNIERRIQSYFGERYGISVESVANEGTKVTVRLPVNNRGL